MIGFAWGLVYGVITGIAWWATGTLFWSWNVALVPLYVGIAAWMGYATGHADGRR